MIKKLTNLLLLVVLLAGCREVHDIAIKKEDKNILFDLSYTKQKYPNKKVILRELEVVQKNCQTTCTSWSITGDEDSSSILNFVYGIVPAGMKEVIPAKALTAGDYAVSGGVWLVEGKDISGPIAIVGGFSVP